ncbi:LysR family transcriptional regulator substrate-binding protein [Fusibacter sp. Q10-2]|uniref:LysR family transcriptional regulator substrate-binding protein n=1 Tax=Fusibacter ferrireducens TaxID=2785058 RepID=A0ABR9ZXR2_9FIRM|nr:LysR family transcriptional regulator substrate-binding protein [Fusibacter ferrireducens]MBF4695258.1 LysR family transcriptional regulator substrate-binding protein [Fusibacter ferrireducens]
MEELISKGKLDMALIAKPDHRKEMTPKSILEDEVILVAHKDFDLNCEIHNFDNGNQWIELESLHKAKIPFILSPPRTILGKLARSYFRDISPPVMAINQNCSAEMAVALAEEGLGVAFNYRSCSRANSNLKSYSIGSSKRFVPLLLKYPTDNDDYKCRSTLLLAELIKAYFEQK